MKHLIHVGLFAVAAIALSVPAASVDEWLKSGLLHPDLIDSVRDELALTSEQQDKLTRELGAAREQAGPMERAVKEQQKALNHLLQDTTTTAEAASAQLTKLIAAEAALKQLQLRALIGVRDVLSTEQLARARKLAPQKMALGKGGATPAAPAGMEPAVMAKVERLKSALEKLGVPPTEAMKTRGSAIEGLIKRGEFNQADAALDKLVEDSHVNELEAAEDKVDFSKYEPGSTDVESLKQRYEEVKTAAQEIISLPLMRTLMQAKDAFEAAKAAQDADEVGRIFTYVEQKLKQQDTPR